MICVGKTHTMGKRDASKLMRARAPPGTVQSPSVSLFPLLHVLQAQSPPGDDKAEMPLPGPAVAHVGPAVAADGGEADVSPLLLAVGLGVTGACRDVAFCSCSCSSFFIASSAEAS